MRYDLICIIPLYGENCGRVSSRMCASISSAVTTKKIKIVFIYDSTVSVQSLFTINQIMTSTKNTYDIEYVFSGLSSSGYKRNYGIRYYSDSCDLIWLLDQDDWLLIDDFDPIIDIAKETIESGQPCIKIPFQRPINEEVYTNIDEVLSMPWQYIYNPQVAKKYKFDEDIEMGSDIPFVVGILVDNNLYNYETGKLSAITFNKYIYYYNYLNPYSESIKELRNWMKEKGNEPEIS